MALFSSLKWTYFHIESPCNNNKGLKYIPNAPVTEAGRGGLRGAAKTNIHIGID